MQTIIVASQKGGAGKSTLCAHLAVQARLSGQTVYLIDTDPQGSLSSWHDKRATEDIQRVELPFTQIQQGLAILVGKGVDLVLIDTAPSRSDENATLFALADLVLIPVRASPADLWAVGATVQQLKAAGTPFLFVLNAVKASASITAQAAASLSAHGQVAETFLADRTAYAAAMIDGRAAQELAPRGPAAKELTCLHANIQATLQRNMKA